MRVTFCGSVVKPDAIVKFRKKKRAGPRAPPSDLPKLRIPKSATGEEMSTTFPSSLTTAERDIKQTHRLNARIGAGQLLGVRCGCGILMDIMRDPVGYMDKGGMLKDTKEMSFLDRVVEVTRSKMRHILT